jgi:tetratricopeptide (TPR) repeat protein
MWDATEPYYLHAEHYLRVAETASGLCESTEGFSEGMVLLATEWANIQSGWEWAANLGNSEEPAPRPVVNYLSRRNSAQQFTPLELERFEKLATLKRIIESAGLSALQDRESLAALYFDQGRYGHGEPLVLRVLAAYAKCPGCDQHAVARSLNNVARLFGAQGRYAEAEPFLLRALDVAVKSLGAEHPYTAELFSDLGLIYERLNLYSEAKWAYECALSLFIHASGPEHPSVTKINRILKKIEARHESGGDGVASVAPPNADAEVASPLNITPIEELKLCEALPWWKRLLNKWRQRST